jgi:hypothetical protein
MDRQTFFLSVFGGSRQWRLIVEAPPAPTLEPATDVATKAPPSLELHVKPVPDRRGRKKKPTKRASGSE